MILGLTAAGRGALIAFGILLSVLLINVVERAEVGKELIGFVDVAVIIPALVALLVSALLTSERYKTWRRDRLQRQARAWMEEVERSS